MENIMQEAWERAKKEQKEQMAKSNMRIVGKEEEALLGKRSPKWKETWERRNDQYKAKSVAITEALMCIMLYKKKYLGVPLHVGGNKTSGLCYKVFYSYKKGYNLKLESICIICGAYDVKLDLKVKDPKLAEDLIKIEKDIIQINMKKGYSVDKIIDRVFLAKLQYLLARLKIKEGYTTADMAEKYDLNPHSLGAILDPRSRTKRRNPYNYSIITILGMAKIVGATVTISLLNGKPATIKKALLTEYNNCVSIGKRYTNGTRESNSNANFDLNPSFYYKSMIPFEERNPDIKFEDTILKKVLVKSDNIDLGIKPTYGEEDKPELNAAKKVETVPVFQPEVNSVDDTLTDTHTEESPAEHVKEEPKEVISIEQVEVAIGGVTVTVPANIVDKDGKKVIRLAIDIAIK